MKDVGVFFFLSCLFTCPACMTSFTSIAIIPMSPAHVRHYLNWRGTFTVHLMLKDRLCTNADVFYVFLFFFRRGGGNVWAVYTCTFSNRVRMHMYVYSCCYVVWLFLNWFRSCLDLFNRQRVHQDQRDCVTLIEATKGVLNRNENRNTMARKL